MTHINLTDEEVAEIVANTASEFEDPLMGLCTAIIAGRVIGALVEATDGKREKKKIDKKTVETIKAGPWTISFVETSNNKTQLVMMFRDHCRVDRMLENKHDALSYAFNILLS